MKYLIKIIFVSTVLISASNCSKKTNDPTPASYTNTGTGTINYNAASDTLIVKAIVGNSYLLSATGSAPPSSSIYVSMLFPKGRPKAGYYTPLKDSINVSLTAGNTLFWSMKSTDTVTVSVSGTTITASFKNATFDLDGYTPTTENKYTATLICH